MYPHFLLFLNHPAPTQIYTLSLHDALPISFAGHPTLGTAHVCRALGLGGERLTLEMPAGIITVCATGDRWTRSEEHTSELQSHSDLVCRLLLEKKKKK